MCMIAAARAGVVIPKKYLKNGFRENGHGAGFMVAKNGKILLRKGFTSFKEFWRVFREYQSYDKVVHFRWGNVGKINAENCHPFWVSPNLAMAHNGTISIATKDGKSDTRTFTELVLQQLNKDDEDFLKNPQLTFLISKAIGQSKLAFLDAAGEITIINKHLGKEHENIWFSNDDYKAFPTTVYAGRHNKATSYQSYYQGMMGGDAMMWD